MNQDISKLKLIYKRLVELENGSKEFASQYQKYSSDRAIFIAQANAYETAKATIAKYFPEVVR